MSTPSSEGWPKPSTSVGYGVAVLTVATAVIAARLFAEFLDTNPIVSLFLCGIMFVAWFGGLGPAWLAAVLSVLAFVYYFASPVHSFIFATKDLPRIVLFAAAAVFVVLLSAAQRSTAELLQSARDRLAEAERELRLTLDWIPTLAWHTRPDGFAEYLNKRWLDYTGLSLHEALGWEWRKAIHPDDLAGLLAEWQRILGSGQRAEVEARMRRHDGEYRWFLFRPEPLRDASGKIVRWYGTNTDIEDRKQAEDALRRSEAYLAEAQRLSQTGSFGWKIASGDISWSRETYRIFEIDEAIKPTMELALERVHHDDLAVVQRQIERARRGETDYDYEHRLLMPRGLVKNLHVLARRVKYESGDEEIVGAVMDITETKRAQEALHAAQAELAHVTRITTLGQLSVSIAHEVSQPLVGIVTNGDACLRWLERDVPEIEEARRAVKRIISDADRASNVIRRIRDLAKNVTPEMARVDINEVIEDAILLVQRQTLGHRATLRLDLAAGLPEVLGDRVQLQQVIINLLINGLEAMAPVTGRSRDLVVRSQVREDGQVLVAVQDAGVGIAPEMADKLFNAFYTTKPDGMGMGLSICRSIVEAHGGQMWATNNDGPGATIEFTVPQYQSRQ
jgi:PAS domain S-box-containing protein